MPTVKINVLEAQNLFGADLDGNSDPYCVVKIGEGNQFSCIERTRTIKNTKNPTWKEVFTLNVNNPLTESLFVEVMNKERSKDNSLGYAQMPLHDLTRGIEKQVWLQLEGGTQSTGVIGAIASHLGKKKEKVNQGKVFLGVTALDFGLDTSTYPPGQGGMMHGVPLGQVQQQHLPGMQQPGMQPGLQPGMQQPGMQQGVIQPGMQQPGMQQGGIQQHSGLPGTQQYPGTGSSISHEGMSQPPPQHFVGSNQPGIQSGMAPGMQSGMQQPHYTEHGLQQPTTGVQPGVQQYPGGIQQQTGLQQGIQHQPGMQYPPSSGSSHHDQPKSAYPENL